MTPAKTYRIPSDGNVIELQSKAKPRGGGLEVYTYKYTQSETKLGQTLPLTLEQLQAAVRRGAFVEVVEH